MEKGLKRCPFCGTEPTTAINLSKCGGGELRLKFSVVCPNCKTSKGFVREVEGENFGRYIDIMADVINIWNRRITK